MIIPIIQRLLKSKYNGSRVIITRNKTCADDNITIMVQTTEEFVDEVDTIQREVLNATKINLAKIEPMIER